MREGERGKREAGSGKREQAPARPFAEVMREQGMTPPAALARSIDAALGGDSARGGDPEEVLRAAKQLLDRVLANQCESRDSAIDLLTVDALVTRAMEIAARDPQSLAEFPELAMKRIAAK
jgi:hypothetical protein